jgi:hypothetical protein
VKSFYDRCGIAVYRVITVEPQHNRIEITTQSLRNRSAIREQLQRTIAAKLTFGKEPRSVPSSVHYLLTDLIDVVFLAPYQVALYHRYRSLDVPFLSSQEPQEPSVANDFRERWLLMKFLRQTLSDFDKS